MNKTDSFGNILPKMAYVVSPKDLDRALMINSFRMTVDHLMHLGDTVRYDATTKTAAITNKDTGLISYAQHP